MKPIQSTDYTTTMNEFKNIFHSNKPSTEMKAEYTFSDAFLYFDNKNLLGSPSVSNVYEPESGKCNTISITIDGIMSSCGKEKGTRPIHVRLHKKGQRKPLFETDYTPMCDNDYFHQTIIDEQALTTGDYAVSLTNICPANDEIHLHLKDNVWSYPFRILPHGSRMEHPVFARATARMEDTAHPCVCGAMHLRLDCCTPFGEGSIFDFRCYSHSAMLMSQATAAPGTRPGRMSIEADLTSSLAWLPDCYVCIVSQNSEPFARIEMELREDYTVSCNCQPLSVNDLYYLPVKQMETESDSSTWCKFSRHIGCAPLKTRAMELLKRNRLNELRKDNHLVPLPNNGHFRFVCMPHPENMLMIADFAALCFPNHTFKQVDASTLTATRNAVDPLELTTELLDENHNIICLHNISSLMWGNGNMVMEKIERKLMENDDTVLFIVASPSEADRFAETCPAIMSVIPPENRIGFPDYSLTEVIHSIQQQLCDKEIGFAPEALRSLCAEMGRHLAEGEVAHPGFPFASGFIRKCILPRFERRMLNVQPDSTCNLKTFLSTLTEADIDWNGLDNTDDLYAQSMKELGQMVGLEVVKQTIADDARRLRFSMMRRRQGLPSFDTGAHHLIFTGSPGTGKTTVAKLVGHIYHALGLLSVGDVVVAERGNIVGRYIGETEQNMQRLLEKAKGNVLFIDEAYSLCDTTEDRKDYGYRIIECLLTVLSQHNPDMIVILAGYEEDMERMLQSNQGLKGRFPYQLHFEDYTAAELMQIGCNRLKAQQLQLCDEAEGTLRRHVESIVRRKRRDFSNARWMEQFIRHSLVPAMAQRIIEAQEQGRDVSMQTIEPCDVLAAIEKEMSIQHVRHARHQQIGFC